MTIIPMHRALENFLNTDTAVTISNRDEFHHLLNVLRVRHGDAIELVNGRGTLARGKISSIEPHQITVGCLAILNHQPQNACRITLACAIPKRSKFETIIEKATELGVDRIVPLITQRTEVTPNEERAEKKTQRYRSVITNACKQSKRLWFPEILLPMPFDQALTELLLPGVISYIPWLEGERPTLLSELSKNTFTHDIVIFIGPEGDFTPEEVQKAVSRGAMPVTLGDNVLKVDTAALAVVALTRFYLNDRAPQP